MVTAKYGVRGLLVMVGLMLATTAPVLAQTASLRGRVGNDAGQALSGAQIAVTNLSTGSTTGTLTGGDGTYTLTLRPGIQYRVEVRMLGFGAEVVESLRLTDGENRALDFTLGTEAVSIEALEIFAERAIDRRTPVAYTNVDRVQIDRQLASRDIPLVLNTTPSVYATMQGGGAGDARVNVRGFTQRNIGVMINGVPVNDMENGWVYWSNWDGVGDATSSIQLQRGLSAVNLATPSIGGTLNIITDPSSMNRRLMVKQEFGNDGFLKTTAQVSSGLLGDRFALMAAGVRKTGDGVIDGTWTDAWAYYLAAAYIINGRNRLDLFALGAPQMHGQLAFKQNIAAFSHEYASGLDDYDQAALDRYPEASSGRTYNQNFNRVTVPYNGQQHYAGSIMDRHDDAFLNERVNHFHKPQVNLNWYSQLSSNLLWSTVAYYSGGKGGGSGTIGSFLYNTDGPSRIIDWDATINRNQTNLQGDGRAASRGILRSSRNNQWTIGAISKLKAQVTPEIVLEVGADWRTAEIEHYRDVVDLLGGDYYPCTGGCASEFWSNPGEFEVGLGDRIDYFNTNTVDWVGGFIQSEYAKDRLSAYGMLGLSTIRYTLIDHFRRDDVTGQAIELESDNIGGVQIKGGGLVNVTDALDLFVNGGYVAKVPIFDDVINDVNVLLNDDPKNEKFTSFEAGATYRSQTAPVTLKGNVYYTTWNDRAQTNRFFDENGEDYFVTLTGLDQRHMGVEMEAAWQPSERLRFDLAGSVGNWKYTADVDGRYSPEGADTTFTYDFYIDGLKVGDAPQTQFAFGAMVFPTPGLFVQAVGKSYFSNYADFNPFDRTDPADRTQSWKVPNYSVFDLHAGYDLNMPAVGSRVRLFANVFNLFDTVYVQDALDNSSFNGFAPLDHEADDAEVFMGLPRTFTLGLQIIR
ncbi:MAG: TonB-dependent receptor [Longimicrobiales bacterium]